MTREFRRGEIVFRQGSPAGPMFLVRSGAVRIFCEQPDAPGIPVVLGRQGPGDHFGELSSLLGRARSATVQALEDTELVELTPERMRSSLRSTPRFTQALMRSLMQRAGLSLPEAAAVLSDEGLERAATAAGQFGDARAPSERAKMHAPAYDASVLSAKEGNCPACATVSYSLRVRPSKDQPSGTDTDFRPQYRTKCNPNNYTVLTCPSCLYSALPDDFEGLTREQAVNVPEVVTQVVRSSWEGERPDFNVDRTLELREKSLELALAIYRLREAPPLRLAAVLQRLGWCAREREDAEAEEHWLRQALAFYVAAYTTSEVENPKSEIRLMYLCGELSLRVGEYASAVEWFIKVTSHPDIQGYPVWHRQARERWAEARTLTTAA